MSIYLGQLGRLVELKCPASLQVTPEDRYSFQTTAEGKVRGQVRPSLGRRVWSLGTSDATTPRDQGAIMAFANGEWGPGPFVFVPADAPVMNMLSPEAASCAPGAFTAGSGTAVGEAGPLNLGTDGWAGRSYSNNGAGTVFFGAEKVPVLQGGKVTVSAYVLGAGAIARIAWYDAAGGSLGSTSSAIMATAGTVTRSWVTATPPAGAASAYACAVNATAMARPALTWTDTLLDWADGQGCPKAVLHAPSRSLVMASSDPRGGRYSNLSFTVQEVG